MWLSVLSFVVSTGIAIGSLLVSLANKRRLDTEVTDRKAAETRVVRLLRELPSSAAKSRGNPEFLEFTLGEDPVLDRAVRLAHEWRSVLIRWNEGNYQVRLRTLNEPPDSEQRFQWH